jgi:hypothetical protein
MRLQGNHMKIARVRNRCVERARLYRLRKNSIQDGFVTGHGFSRADKANQMSWALAPAKADSCSSLGFGSLSAASEAVPYQNSCSP